MTNCAPGFIRAVMMMIMAKQLNCGSSGYKLSLFEITSYSVHHYSLEVSSTKTEVSIVIKKIINHYFRYFTRELYFSR